MKARVTVRLKNGVLDPQGKALVHAASAMKCEGVRDIRVGKIFEIDLDAEDKSQAEGILRSFADKLLANTVIENFEVELKDS